MDICSFQLTIATMQSTGVARGPLTVRRRAIVNLKQAAEEWMPPRQVDWHNVIIDCSTIAKYGMHVGIHGLKSMYQILLSNVDYLALYNSVHRITFIYSKTRPKETVQRRALRILLNSICCMLHLRID